MRFSQPSVVPIPAAAAPGLTFSPGQLVSGSCKADLVPAELAVRSGMVGHIRFHRLVRMARMAAAWIRGKLVGSWSRFADGIVDVALARLRQFCLPDANCSRGSGFSEVSSDDIVEHLI